MREDTLEEQGQEMRNNSAHLRARRNKKVRHHGDIRAQKMDRHGRPSPIWLSKQDAAKILGLANVEVL